MSRKGSARSPLRSDWGSSRESRQPSPQGRSSSARRRSPRNNPVLIGGVAGAVLVTAILCAWFLTASAGVADDQKRRDAAAAQLSATPVPPPTSPQSSALEQEKAARVTALSSALGSRLAWDRLLRPSRSSCPTTSGWHEPVRAGADRRALPRGLHGQRAHLLAGRRGAAARPPRAPCLIWRTSRSSTAPPRRARPAARSSSSRSTQQSRDEGMMNSKPSPRSSQGSSPACSCTPSPATSCSSRPARQGRLVEEGDGRHAAADRAVPDARRSAKATPPIRVAELFRLTKAKYNT